MSSLLHPVGPEPERVYWMRRIIFIVLCLAVLAVAGKLLSFAFGSRGSTVTAQPTPNASSLVGSVATPTPTPTPTPTLTPGATSAASATSATSATSARSASSPASSTNTPTRTPTPTPSQAAVCAASSLTLKTQGTASVKSGSPTQLKVAITNASGTPCTLNFKQVPLVIKVYSGTDRIWSTEDCSQWAPRSTTQTLPAGRSWTFGVTWPTLRSASGCQLKDTYLQPGTYVATSTIGGTNPSQFVMSLHG